MPMPIRGSWMRWGAWAILGVCRDRVLHLCRLSRPKPSPTGGRAVPRSRVVWHGPQLRWCRASIRPLGWVQVSDDALPDPGRLGAEDPRLDRPPGPVGVGATCGHHAVRHAGRETRRAVPRRAAEDGPPGRALPERPVPVRGRLLRGLLGRRPRRLDRARRPALLRRGHRHRHRRPDRPLRLPRAEVRRAEGVLRHHHPRQGHLQEAFVKGLLGADAFTDTAALRKLIGGVLTPETMADIADAHRAGRRLYVGTTEE